MKILKSIVLVGALAVACIALSIVKAQDCKTNSASLCITMEDVHTCGWNPSTNFLTISNRVWVQFGGSAIVRVSDAEWRQITNAYPDKLTTDSLSFWK
jgi:hypothetical protein